MSGRVSRAGCSWVEHRLVGHVGVVDLVRLFGAWNGRCVRGGLGTLLGPEGTGVAPLRPASLPVRVGSSRLMRTSPGWG